MRRRAFIEAVQEEEITRFKFVDETINTMIPNGLQSALTVSGAINGDIFAAYLERVLGPILVLGDVVVLDNLPAHQVAGLAEIVAARGARLLYPPPYSPDFNPIERVFSKLKTWLRTAQARTRETLEATAATKWISQ